MGGARTQRSIFLSEYKGRKLKKEVDCRLLSPSPAEYHSTGLNDGGLEAHVKFGAQSQAFDHENSLRIEVFAIY